MPVQKQNLSIPEFFEGKSVFVTGGMGFLGKVLIEKLLRSCPGVENVYLLCRSKKGKNVNERLEEITELPLFDLVRKDNPQTFNKIILIEGDVSMLGLGISKTDQELLKEKVSVVMHSAATTYFNEPLKIAVNTNLRGMRELLALSRSMKHLKSFVHISTAYTNWFEMDVAEVVRPTAFDPNLIINLCEGVNDEILSKITPILLGKHTNTYTFTKNLSEKLIQNEAADLPIAIVRPGIVSASMLEPMPGWVDSWTATTPLSYTIAIGMYRSIQHIKNFPLEVIPVDLAINMIIAAAWKAAMEKASNPKASFPLVYHSSTGAQNPTTMKQLFQGARDYGRNQPYNQVVWYPKLRMYESKLLHKIDEYVLHLAPAFLVDFLTKLAGKQPKMVKTFKKIETNFDAVRFAATNRYIFQTKNSNNILVKMTESDKKTFNFDPKSINWNKFVFDLNNGVKKFLIKEKSISPSFKMAQLNRLKYASYVVNGTIAFTSLYMIAKAATLLFKSRSTD